MMQRGPGWTLNNNSALSVLKRADRVNVLPKALQMRAILRGLLLVP